MRVRIGGWRRAGMRVAQGAVAAVALYLFAAVLGALVPAGTSGSAGPAGREAASPAVTIALLPGPIHYDFLLPLTPETRTRFAALAELGVPIDHPDAAWIVIGWGSEAFYTTVGTYRDVAPKAVWRAVSGDRSVLRVDLYGAVTPEARSRTVSFSAAQYASFLDAVAGSLRSGPDGGPVLVQGPASGEPGWFLAARARFDVFRTCNVWVGQMLRAAGLRFGIWTPAPFSVRLSHALYQR